MTTKKLICPISAERVDETAVRIVAGITLISTLIGIFAFSQLIFSFLAIDFAIRAFNLLDGKSTLKVTAKIITALLNLPQKFMDAAPKKFAAGIGLVFALIISLLFLLNYVNFAVILACILAVCATLEAFFAVCLGCIVYTHLILPFKKEK